MKIDFSSIEERLMANLPKEEPFCAKIRLNHDEYRKLKATIFMLGYSVGSSKITEADRFFAGIKIEVDDSLKEVQYFDQHGNKLVPK